MREVGCCCSSVYVPIDNAIRTSADRFRLMTRTEVHCRGCGGHLKYVFDDGPVPTEKRCWSNGVALQFNAG